MISLIDGFKLKLGMVLGELAFALVFFAGLFLLTFLLICVDMVLQRRRRARGVSR